MEFNPIHTAVSFLILLALPPFFIGTINKTKAVFAGRRGPPLLQPLFDLIKIFRRQSVLSQSATPLFRLAPVLIVTAILTAGLILPLWGGPVIHFEGDIILFAYLLAFARFFMILAGLDVGSSFEGMGVSREAFFGALSELAFFGGLIVLAITSHSISFQQIFFGSEAHTALKPALSLIFVAFFFVLLVENSRIPIDDPNTHLELTMIHEVMILDYSGKELGWMLVGAQIKLFLFMFLAASVLWPQPITAGLPALGMLVIKGAAMAVAIGVVESITARIKLIKIPSLLFANFVITALALLVALLGKGN